MPDIPDGIYIAIITGLVSVGLAVVGWLRYRRKDRVEVEAQRQVALSERFDDASELAQYIDNRVAQKTAPFQKQLEDVEKAAGELREAFGAYVTHLWFWDRGGREGPLPMPPAPFLHKIGLIHLTASEVSEDTEPI